MRICLLFAHGDDYLRCYLLSVIRKNLAMHRRTPLWFLFGLLAAPALSFADTAAPPVLASHGRAVASFWGIRQDCFFDGMIADAVASRAVIGSPIRALSVPRNAATMGCFGKACVEKSAKSRPAQTSICQAGHWWRGRRVCRARPTGHKLRLWKYLPATDSVLERRRFVDRMVFKPG